MITYLFVLRRPALPTPLQSSGFAHIVIQDEQLIHRDAVDPRQDNRVIDGRKIRSPLPLVDGLRRFQPDHLLKIPYPISMLHPQPANSFPCFNHVDCRYHFHTLYLLLIVHHASKSCSVVLSSFLLIYTVIFL